MSSALTLACHTHHLSCPQCSTLQDDVTPSHPSTAQSNNMFPHLNSGSHGPQSSASGPARTSPDGDGKLETATWTPVHPHLHASTSAEGFHFLMRFTFDRLVLFCELRPFHFDAFLNTAELTELDFDLCANLVQSLRCQLSMLEHPLRYLPPGCYFRPSTSDDFNYLVRTSRPPGWTWLEHLSAGGTLSCAALALCLNEVFEETAHLKGLEEYFLKSPGHRMFSFASRCHASGASHLLLNHSFDIADKEDPLKPGLRPRNRISAVASMIATPHAQAPPSATIRFLGHLLRERATRLMISSVAGSWKTCQLLRRS